MRVSKYTLETQTKFVNFTYMETVLSNFVAKKIVLCTTFLCNSMLQYHNIVLLSPRASLPGVGCHGNPFLFLSSPAVIYGRHKGWEYEGGERTVNLFIFYTFYTGQVIS